GETVALLGPNSPFYVATTLGVTQLGAVTALINTHLTGAPLAHALREARCRLVLVHRRHEEAVRALGLEGVELLVYGPGPFDEESARPGAPLAPVKVESGSDFVYIYTSGTTGLPKPCRVTHGRAVVAGSMFAAAVWRFEPGDKVYCVLPLYHSSGLLLGVGAAIMGGAAVALRESFSARAFWSDAVRYQATGMLYIGEICRHLLATAPGPDDRAHRLRVAVGNGMRTDVWEPFARRFGVPQIREFYAATEAPGGIFNFTGRVGSVGHLPLRHLLPGRLARYDLTTGEHVRDARGRCLDCAPNEEGELLVRISEKPLISGLEFKGYTDEAATRKKILTDVFRPGDRYYRSGDLMRVDEDGFFYFVDRLGDTFRWKGENVSTEQVAQVLLGVAEVAFAVVYGVPLAGREGRAGMAAIELRPGAAFDGAAVFAAVEAHLPSPARPRFVRLVAHIELNASFKPVRAALREQGADPSTLTDPLFVYDESARTYSPLTTQVWSALSL
ncbi:MAG: long-chain-acyl-CoA synthetase, partial [Myxococcales bacterium]